jgi:hypothetical protein
MTRTIAAAIFCALLTVAAVQASPPLVYTNPPTSEYFRGPPGKGKLRICKEIESEWEDIKQTLEIPMGSSFSDLGPNDAIAGFDPKSGEGVSWILDLVTTEKARLKPGQRCVSVRAHVDENTEPPPAHPEMQPVMRFEKADNRVFFYMPPPNMTAWPEVEATAETDFK